MTIARHVADLASGWEDEEGKAGTQEVCWKEQDEGNPLLQERLQGTKLGIKSSGLVLKALKTSWSMWQISA